MDLDSQIQELIANAPEDDLTSAGIMAIAPVLKLLASRFRHQTYFIWENSQQQWVVTTLAHRSQANIVKNLVYAFSTAGDATKFHNTPGFPRQIGIISLIFQLLALETVDSLAIFDTPGDIISGKEIEREDLQKLIYSQLQQMYPVNSNLPPDIA